MNIKKIINLAIFICLVFFLAIIFKKNFYVNDAEAVGNCGNGICTPQVEDCNSCPQDCGSCPVPTPTTVPPTATPGPVTPTVPPDLIPEPTSSSPTATSAPGSSTETPTVSTTAAPSPTPTPIIPPIIITNLKQKMILKEKVFIIQGRVIPSEFTEIVNAEISIDDGLNWIPLTLNNNNFIYRFSGLEDNNYLILIRALDKADNYGYSERATLVVDNYKPMIGGSTFNLGPLFLNPNSDGRITSIVGNKNNLVVSTQGGVTEAAAVTDEKTFSLKRIGDTNLWQGEIIFNQDGLKNIKIIVKDGIGTTAERELNHIIVHKSGVIINAKNNQIITNARITVFYFDGITNEWVEWDGSSFGQKNPQYSDQSGRYSFFLPAGEYFLKIEAKNYRQVLSSKIVLNKESIISDRIKLEPEPVYLNFLFLPQQITVNPQQAVNDKFLYKTPNNQLADFKIEDLNDKDLSINKDFPKKKIIIFISSWSSETVNQLSVIEKFQQENKKAELVLIGLQDSSSQFDSLLKRGRYDLEGYVSFYGQVAEILNIKTLPEYYFINSDNKISYIYSGLINKETLIKLFNKLK